MAFYWFQTFLFKQACICALTSRTKELFLGHIASERNASEGGHGEFCCQKLSIIILFIIDLYILEIMVLLLKVLNMFLIQSCNWQVNVVKGLKMYENIFTDQELSKINDFVDELRVSGQNGELLGIVSTNFSVFCRIIKQFVTKI